MHCGQAKFWLKEAYKNSESQNVHVHSKAVKSYLQSAFVPE